MHDEGDAENAERNGALEKEEPRYRDLPKSDEGMTDKFALNELLKSEGWKVAAKAAEDLYRQLLRADTISTELSAEDVKVELKARDKAREYITDWFEMIFQTAFEPDILTEEEKDVFVRVSEQSKGR